MHQSFHEVAGKFQIEFEERNTKIQKTKCGVIKYGRTTLNESNFTLTNEKSTAQVEHTDTE